MVIDCDVVVGVVEECCLLLPRPGPPGGACVTFMCGRCLPGAHASQLYVAIDFVFNSSGCLFVKG